MMPLFVVLLPFTVKPLENVGVPLKVGEPLKVPANDAATENVKAERGKAHDSPPPRQLDVACQVFVPVHVLLLARTEPDDGLMPSSTQICVPVEQFTPPGATSCRR